MKIRSYLACAVAVLSLTLAGCGAADDSSTKAAEIERRAQAITLVTPLYLRIDGNSEVYVMSCPNPLPDVPEADACPGSPNIQAALVRVYDRTGRLTSVVVDDRPGGGCLHVGVGTIASGSTVKVLALLQDPGTHRFLVGNATITAP